MKTLASLVRSMPPQHRNARKNFGNINMVRRKDLRRLKRINIYNKEISGQNNDNEWFTSKRLKSMGKQVESRRNNHIGTNPVPPAIMKEMLDVMPKMSDFQYWRVRCYEDQVVARSNKIESCNHEHFISKLPAKIRTDIEEDENEQVPEICEPLLKYIEQLQIFLPLDERHRYNLLQAISFPLKGTQKEQ